MIKHRWSVLFLSAVLLLFVVSCVTIGVRLDPVTITPTPATAKHAAGYAVTPTTPPVEERNHGAVEAAGGAIAGALGFLGPYGDLLSLGVTMLLGSAGYHVGHKAASKSARRRLDDTPAPA